MIRKIQIFYNEMSIGKIHWIVSSNLKVLKLCLESLLSTSIKVSQIADYFFKIGIYIILTESFFFSYFIAQAASSSITRSLFGYYLFPSEIWFLIVGNSLVFILLITNKLKVPRSVLSNAAPLFVVIGAYLLWTFYGFFMGNEFALQDSREMIFNTLSFPAILLLFPHTDYERIFKRLVPIGLVILIAWSIRAAPEKLLLTDETSGSVNNTSLMFAPFFLSYYILSVAIRNRYNMFAVFLSLLPFVISFSKPSLVMLVVTSSLTLILLAYANPDSKRWILSRYKLKIVFYILVLLVFSVFIIYLANKLTNGAIEALIRYSFFKERMSGSGKIHYGDLTGGRFAIWKEAVEEWIEKPLLGYGLGATVKVVTTAFNEKWQYHNYFFQSLHNTGIIGIIMILGGWFIFWRRMFRKLLLIVNQYDKMMFIATSVFALDIMVYGLYGHSLSYPPVAQFFWMCVGFLSVLKISSKEQYETSCY